MNNSEKKPENDQKSNSKGFADQINELENKVKPYFSNIGIQASRNGFLSHIEFTIKKYNFDTNLADQYKSQIVEKVNQDISLILTDNSSDSKEIENQLSETLFIKDLVLINEIIFGKILSAQSKHLNTAKAENKNLQEEIAKLQEEIRRLNVLILKNKI